MITIIKDNPYRVLGVFANSSSREIAASLSKMKAFLKIGKKISFDNDLSDYLGEVDRTLESVEKSQVAITLPKDKIKYAQFWFVRNSELDVEALKLLKNNKLEEACELLKKEKSFSSLNNLIILSIIKNDFLSAGKHYRSDALLFIKAITFYH